MSATERRCFEHRSFSQGRNVSESTRTTHTIEIVCYPHGLRTDNTLAHGTTSESGIAHDTIARHLAFPLAPTTDTAALLHDIVNEHECDERDHEHRDSLEGRDEPDDRRKDGIKKTKQIIFHVKNRRGFMEG